MLSNSKIIFSELSKSLYRAGMYISYADLTGGKKAWKAEMRALSMMMQILEKQNSEESFLHDLAKLASGDLEGVENLKNLSDEDTKNILNDLEAVPFEVENSIRTVLNNFSKPEARLYADILLSAGASVAQAYDEKDDFFLTGDKFVDTVTFLTNAQPLFDRLLMFFSGIHADKNARYLYDSNDIFDEMKISTKETDALSLLSSSVKKAWLEKYPEDLEQTVQDYIEETKQKF